MSDVCPGNGMEGGSILATMEPPLLLEERQPLWSIHRRKGAFIPTMVKCAKPSFLAPRTLCLVSGQADPTGQGPRHGISAQCPAKHRDSVLCSQSCQNQGGDFQSRIRTHPPDPRWCYSPSSVGPGLMQGFSGFLYLQPHPTES